MASVSARLFSKSHDIFPLIASYLPDKEAMDIALACKTNYEEMTSNGKFWEDRAESRGTVLQKSPADGDKAAFLAYSAFRVQGIFHRGYKKGAVKLQEILNRPGVSDTVSGPADFLGVSLQELGPGAHAIMKIAFGLLKLPMDYYQCRFLRLTAFLSLRAFYEDRPPEMVVDLAYHSLSAFVTFYAAKMTFEGGVYLTRNTGLLERLYGYKETLPLRASLCAQKVKKIWANVKGLLSSAGGVAYDRWFAAPPARQN